MPRLTESNVTTKLLSTYRVARPEALAWKLNDRTNGGYPDFVLIDAGACWWWEVKRTDNQLTGLQVFHLGRLVKQNKGRAGVIWLDFAQKTVTVCPHALGGFTFPLFPLAQATKKVTDLLVKLQTGVLTP